MVVAHCKGGFVAPMQEEQWQAHEHQMDECEGGLVRRSRGGASICRAVLGAGVPGVWAAGQ